MRCNTDRRRHSFACVLYALLFMGLVSGCGGTEQADNGVTEPDPPPDGPDVYEGFAFISILNQPQGQVSYLHRVPSLDADVTVDLTEAIESSGGAAMHGGNGTGAVFLSSAESPRVTRYDVTRDGTFVQGATIDVGGTVGEAAANVYVASPDTAYYFDEALLRLVTFDPTEMVLRDEIDLSSVRPEGALQTAFGNPSRRDNELIIPIVAIDGDRFPIIDAVAVILDLETNTVSITRDGRCGYVFDSVVTDSGDVYLAASPYYSAHNFFFPEDFPPACMLRIPAGERTIDPDYFIDLNAVSGGLPTGGIAPGPGPTVYLKAFDESAVLPSQIVTPFFTLALSGWRLWSFDIETEASESIPSFGLSSGGIGYAIAGDRRFLGSTATDFSGTTLFDADTLEEAISFPGFPNGFVELP
ncbi:MAG: hypothetical protein AAGF92_16825 [Myxococcota bacterium]